MEPTEIIALIAATGIEPSPDNCHEFSAKLVFACEKIEPLLRWQIVNGWVVNHKGKRVNHTWVEGGGWVVDCGGGLFPREEFHARMRVEVRRVYSSLQAHEEMLQVGYWDLSGERRNGVEGGGIVG